MSHGGWGPADLDLTALMEDAHFPPTLTHAMYISATIPTDAQRKRERVMSEVNVS